MSRHLLNATYDAATVLADGVTSITASAAGQVASANKILDVGLAMLEAVMIVDVISMDLTTGDEGYDITLQGSSSSTFASDVNTLQVFRLGSASATGNSATKGVGRYAAQVLNSLDGATPYRYLRLYVKTAGTTPILSASAFLTKEVL